VVQRLYQHNFKVSQHRHMFMRFLRKMNWEFKFSTALHVRVFGFPQKLKVHPLKLYQHTKLKLLNGARFASTSKV
jgi:hypothetical protein